MTKKQRKVLIRIIISASLTLLINFLPIRGLTRLLLFAVPYIIIGYDILRKAFLGLIHGRCFDENFLMAIATVGAFALAVYSKSGDYNEAVAVMLFYQIGELFQSIALGKSRKSIAALMDIRPEYATLERDGELVRVSPDEVEVGDTITVSVGEKIALDGVIVGGSSALDTSALTGESLLRTASVGDRVLSGCVNMSSPLRIRVEKPFSESAVSKILELVENASSRKSRSEKIISRFARVYTPTVCILALALAFIPSAVGAIAFGESNFHVWLYRALTFLVISCPCALVISIPLGFFAGIGAASHEGILIKGSNYLEALSQTSYAVFDKTGTLTEGSFGILSVECAEGITKEKVIEYAAHAEAFSPHPIAKSITEAYGHPIDRQNIEDISEKAGCGVIATVRGHSVAVGNEKLLEDLGISTNLFHSEEVGTRVYVAIDGKTYALITLGDKIKPTSVSAISSLRSLGIKNTVMLTGDSKATAKAVGEKLGITDIRAELLPTQKVEEIEKLLETKKPSDKLAFIGDGINDAPSLARADIGIAMGALGSDAAIEAADVVLMNDDPSMISKAISISKRTMGIVRQNIIFSLSIKFLCLLLASFGIANMWLGIFADVGVMVLAVLNSVRAMFVKKSK